MPYTPLEGPTVGRRGIKEYRAPEALILIAADRDQKPLVCPSCGSLAVERVPERSSAEDAQGIVDVRRNEIFVLRMWGTLALGLLFAVLFVARAL